MVVPSVSVVAACGAALYFGLPYVWREAPVETHAAVALPAVSPAVSIAQDAPLAVIAAAHTEANADANALAAAVAVPLSTNTAESAGSAPTFDVARIEPNGDSVIAGRAAPGATVELLRDGERHDRVVADQSGQFVMTPPRLPAGSYALTLRSESPDGTTMTSKQDVAVALDATAAGSGATQSPAALSADVAATKPTSGPPQDAALSKLPHTATAATTAPEGDSTSAIGGPRVATVSRGDSLWRISRLTYGVGTRYAIVYKANRNLIHDPNRIYPGQVFVLPMQAH